MHWDEITAVCVAVSLVGTIGLFLVRAIMQDGLRDFLRQVEQRFATKEHVQVLKAQVDGLEKRFEDSRNVQHGD